MNRELKSKAGACRKSLGEVKRIAIKLGTSVVTHDSGELALGRVYGIIEDIVALKRRGTEVILVSSGAVGLGAGKLRMAPQLLPEKQACAAVGQGLLMAVYEQAFERFGMAVAQMLLTEEDFSNRARYLNLRNTFNALLAMGVLPIVNENDPVSTAELELKGQHGGVFGDNDRLCALVMSKMEAEALLILTDVDGLYANRSSQEGGELLSAVDGFESADFAPGAGGRLDGATGPGRGGIQTKLEAMRICTESGGIGVIANGKSTGIIGSVMAGQDVGTVFIPSRRLSSRKRWIAFASEPAGRVVVTVGARKALQERGASLLFAGVEAVEGNFARGDVLAIVDERGREFARGISNHSCSVAEGLIGKHTKAVVALTHEPNFDAFVGRDNLVLTKK